MAVFCDAAVGEIAEGAGDDFAEDGEGSPVAAEGFHDDEDGS